MSTRHADITTDQYTAARKPPLFDAARCPGDARRRRWSGDGPGPAVDGPIEGGATDEDRARDEDRGGERELVPLPSSGSLFASPAPVPSSRARLPFPLRHPLLRRPRRVEPVPPSTCLRHGGRRRERPAPPRPRGAWGAAGGEGGGARAACSARALRSHWSPSHSARGRVPDPRRVILGPGGPRGTHRHRRWICDARVRGGHRALPPPSAPLLLFARPSTPDSRLWTREPRGRRRTRSVSSATPSGAGRGREARRWCPVPPLPSSSSPALDSRPRLSSPQPLKSEPQSP